MSQYIWAVVFMHGLGMQVLALNSSAGKGHDLICISLGSFTSKLLWALKFTEKKSTHFLRSILEGFAFQCGIITKKRRVECLTFSCLQSDSQILYMLQNLEWHGQKEPPPRPQDATQGYRERGAASTVLSAGCAVSAGRPCWYLPFSPSRSLTQLIQGICPRKTPSHALLCPACIITSHTALGHYRHHRYQSSFLGLCPPVQQSH